jgi:N-acetylmuramoyl-L-alanine amidase
MIPHSFNPLRRLPTSGFFNARSGAILGIFVLLSASCPLAGNSQQLIPVLKQNDPSSSVLSEWKTFMRVSEFQGCAYVSLMQVAAIMDGHLHWKPVSKQVDLSIRGRDVRFFYNSKRVILNGQPQHLEQSTVKNEDGFWVPASFFASQRFFNVSRARLQWPPPAAPTAKADEKKAVSAVPSAPLSPRSSAVLTAKAIKRIVIDPGHGGKDPGTVGIRGTEEKTINLLVAQALAQSLRDDGDYEVLLTRTDDTFIPLAERAALANRYNADLFISVHCNASLSPKLKGMEVYFLSERASDPHADAVARAENAPLALEGGSSRSQAKLQLLLRSLVKNVNINESSALGGMVDREVGQSLGENTLGVKQAAFYVLRGAEMPAVLIETGFLSNKSEEKDLLNPSFRQKLVSGIVEAIKDYDKRKQKERLSS